MFSSDVDAKLIKNQDVIVFIHPIAGWAVVLVNPAHAIKKSNKHEVFCCCTFSSPNLP